MAKIDKNEFRKNLEQAMEEQLGLRLNEPNSIPFTEVFPEEFMKLYTEFETIEAFFEASPWTVEAQDDFRKIPEDEFDEYVDEHTDFPSWEIMLQTGQKRLIERRVR